MANFYLHANGLKDLDNKEIVRRLESDKKSWADLDDIDVMRRIRTGKLKGLKLVVVDSWKVDRVLEKFRRPAWHTGMRSSHVHAQDVTGQRTVDTTISIEQIATNLINGVMVVEGSEAHKRAMIPIEQHRERDAEILNNRFSHIPADKRSLCKVAYDVALAGGVVLPDDVCDHLGEHSPEELQIIIPQLATDARETLRTLIETQPNEHQTTFG